MGIILIIVGGIALVFFRVILSLIANNPNRFIFLLSRLAILVMFCSLIWAGWEWHKLRKRNVAYQTVLTEVGNDEPSFDVIADNVETFIDYPPHLFIDQRDKELKQIYQEEYAKWFIQNPAIPDEVLERRTVVLKTTMNNF